MGRFAMGWALALVACGGRVSAPLAEGAIERVVPPSEGPQDAEGPRELAEARAVCPALVTVAERATATLVVMAPPDQDTAWLHALGTAAQGAWGSAAGDAVLGEAVARELEASVGSELVGLWTAGDGSLDTDLFRVTGVLAKTGEAAGDHAVVVWTHDDMGCLGAKVSAQGHPVLPPRPATPPDEGPGLEVAGRCRVLASAATSTGITRLVEVGSATPDAALALPAEGVATLSTRLADGLAVREGDRLVITTSDATGDLVGRRYRVGATVDRPEPVMYVAADDTPVCAR